MSPIQNPKLSFSPYWSIAHIKTKQCTKFHSYYMIRTLKDDFLIFAPQAPLNSNLHFWKFANKANYCMFLSCHVRISIRPVWLNGWVFVYELSGSGFESSCSHLKQITMNYKFKLLIKLFLKFVQHITLSRDLIGLNWSAYLEGVSRGCQKTAQN